MFLSPSVLPQWRTETAASLQARVGKKYLCTSERLGSGSRDYYGHTCTPKFFSASCLAACRDQIDDSCINHVLLCVYTLKLYMLNLHSLIHIIIHVHVHACVHCTCRVVSSCCSLELLSLLVCSSDLNSATTASPVVCTSHACT